MRGSFVRSTFRFLGCLPDIGKVFHPYLTTMMSFVSFFFFKELPATKEKRSGICAAPILRGVFLSCFFRLPALLDTLRFLFARNLLSTRSSGMSAVCMGICAWAFVLFVPAGSYHKNVKSKASNLESVLFRNEHGKRRGPILMVVNLCDARCFDGFYD
jgi:hypothetical protein